MQRTASRVIILTFCSLLGLFIGVGSFTFWYAQGASYLSDDPAACVNCHVMRPQFAAWQSSSHHAVATCNSCHVPHDLIGKYYTKAENGYHHSYAFTFQTFPETIRMREASRQIVLANCVACHAALMDGIAAHQSDPQQQIDCLRCHAGVGHGANN
ncbi:cytochrome c nitrate reductase, small subunit [Oscillochloris trichoides DG-6]|uniref:Cytochrome c-type protein n=1 Tax=Oscillochloris trichoides DG-6 TaxID=765420 RepID=E1IBM4_9CHLR|nr:cytochrome c nitrite reductase small subunit [Oscillochloris trichoides]EFO81443.1 cytochrome c nitrate reductase, small subunit [Oscillochloris trichoides DG-6]